MIDKQEVAMIKKIGARMREARGLCGNSPCHDMTIEHAAKLLGVDAVFLKSLEARTEIEHFPLWIIHKASEVYDVSTDFLFGFSDDWERDPAICFERQVGHWIYKQHAQDLAKLAVDIDRQQTKIDALAAIVKEQQLAISDIAETVARFQELNKGFENMPAGSQLIHRTRVLLKLANDAKHLLVRCKIVTYDPWFLGTEKGDAQLTRQVKHVVVD